MEETQGSGETQPDFYGGWNHDEDDAAGHEQAQRFDEQPGFRAPNHDEDDAAGHEVTQRFDEQPGFRAAGAAPDFRALNHDEDDAEGHKFVVTRDATEGGPDTATS